MVLADTEREACGSVLLLSSPDCPVCKHFITSCTWRKKVFCTSAQIEVPWIDSLHISSHCLLFPVHCTRLYSPPYISIRSKLKDQIKDIQYALPSICTSLARTDEPLLNWSLRRYFCKLANLKVTMVWHVWTVFCIQIIKKENSQCMCVCGRCG